MFDTILIGTSSLLSHAKGLRIVGNNLANVNTPGFKSAQLAFASLVDEGSDQGGAAQDQAAGSGLATLGSHISFRAGLDQSTGNPLDLNINGNGFYTVKRGGELLYTRSGDFHFDDQGVLVNGAGDHVQGLDGSGTLVDVTVAALEHSMPKATTVLTFQGNLNSTVSSPPVDTTVSNLSVYDVNGVSHLLKLTLVNNGSGDYTVNVTDSAGTNVYTDHLKFDAGFPTAATSVLTFSYAPAGVAAFPVKLDFSNNVRTTAATSTLAMLSQDGYQAGVRTDQGIEADGTLKLHYSNGQTATGARLALANFQTGDDLQQATGSTFAAKAGAQVRYGYAGGDDFGTLAAGHREGSNVDMAEEFSNLILMQRGYQAASHVVSTANDMIQELFDMKGHR